MRPTLIIALLPLVSASRKTIRHPSPGPDPVPIPVPVHPVSVGDGDTDNDSGSDSPRNLRKREWTPLMESMSHCGSYPTTYCASTSYNTTLLTTYLCGDFRLGPPLLAQSLPLDSVFDIYSRLGGLCPGEFLAQFWNSTTNWWNYPAHDGFSLDDSGAQIKGNVTLPVDTLIDRFGGEGGTFTSPAGAPYMQRSLPPSNLNAPQEEWPYCFPYNYHLYKVLKPLVVIAGPIAPWFRQPGQGVQYEMYQNISTLVTTGFLKRIDPKILIPAP